MNLVFLFLNHQDCVRCFSINSDKNRLKEELPYSKFFNFINGYLIKANSMDHNIPLSENGKIQGDYFLIIVKDESLFLNSEKQDPIMVKEFNSWIKQLEILRQKLDDNLQIYLVQHQGGYTIKERKDKDNPRKLRAIENTFGKENIPFEIFDGGFTPTIALIEDLENYYFKKCTLPVTFNSIIKKYINSIFSIQT